MPFGFRLACWPSVFWLIIRQRRGLCAESRASLFRDVVNCCVFAQVNDASKKESIAFAAYQASLFVFPKAKTSFVAFLTSLGYDAALTSSVNLASPAGVGNTAAAGVIAYRSDDNSNQQNNYAYAVFTPAL